MIFPKYMYKDTILKHTLLKTSSYLRNLKYFREKINCQLRNIWENFSVKIILK